MQSGNLWIIFRGVYSLKVNPCIIFITLKTRAPISEYFVSEKTTSYCPL